MNSDGTQDARGTHANPVRGPAGSHDVPAMPPRPVMPPGAPPVPDGSTFLAWLRAPRPEAAAGVWCSRNRPSREEEPEQVPTRQSLSGAVIAFIVGWLVWSL